MSLILRPVRIRLHGGRVLRGDLHIAEGVPLTAYLISKKHFLNITTASWEGDDPEQAVPHLSLRIRRIVWVEPLDSLPLSSATPLDEPTREVELQVGGGEKLRVRLNLARETRMSDYLEANPSFIPLWSVRVEGEAGVLEKVAFGQEAIESVRELEGE